jgi:integrase
MERKLDQGDFSDYSEASKITVGALFKRYIHEGKHLRKKDHANIVYRVNNFLNDTITDTNLLRLSTRHIAEFRDRRLVHWSPSTFNKHKSLLSIVIDTAMNDWDIYIPHNPCRSFKREKEARPRNRILQGDEYDRLMTACEKSKNPYLKAMVEFSIEEAVRQGELLKLTYDDINMQNRTALLRDTKNGEDRTIPLSNKALQILMSVPRNLYGRVFPITRDSLKFWWKQALKEAKLKDFVWHDLRRHSCSFLFEKGLSVPEVQLISGHKDPRVLLNTYTKLDPVKIAKKL